MKSPSPLLFSIILAALGCARPERRMPMEPNLSELVSEARSQHEMRLELAKGLDGVAQWITPEDCDGVVWSAKYTIATGRGDIAAAEYPDQPGRFSRRPFPQSPCYLDDPEQSNGSASSWSRDMGLWLIAWAYKANRADVLSRHAAYGKAHSWKMGTGSQAAIYYTPSLIGILNRVSNRLGLTDLEPAFWPAEAEYVGGLDDYQAHLQMTSIWLRQDIEGSVTDAMHDRILEHSTREAGNPFYWYLRGKYNGDMVPALKACVDGTYGTYVRCGVGMDMNRCILAEQIFACDLVLRYMGE